MIDCITRRNLTLIREFYTEARLVENMQPMVSGVQTVKVTPPLIRITWQLPEARGCRYQSAKMDPRLCHRAEIVNLLCARNGWNKDNLCLKDLTPRAKNWVHFEDVIWDRIHWTVIGQVQELVLPFPCHLIKMLVDAKVPEYDNDENTTSFRINRGCKRRLKTFGDRHGIKHGDLFLVALARNCPTREVSYLYVLWELLPDRMNFRD
ncbi:uncharacterized protein G2W53_027151 [Senna tora]|uniref:Uncharacterized protein n=1 Tax=Senna tora TaxID=362788 RepID=A0A834TIT3_9FABA|nr:uncharacterized protein G2W53_027151 [Senna tora]